MLSVWIIGAGHFGKKAASGFHARFTDMNITLIDTNGEKLKGSNPRIICRDGIRWLDENLDVLDPRDIIIPAIPVHLAGEWLKLRLNRNFQVKAMKMSPDLIQRFPNPISGGKGLIYTSHADFICPDNCPEPKNICTHTGRKRAKDLYKLIESLDSPSIHPIVIRSRQLFPGTGGFTVKALQQAYQKAIQCFQRPLLMATACKCHGVAEVFKVEI